MSEETLLTAARRVVRFVKIDDTIHGGLLQRETIHAIHILDVMVRSEVESERSIANERHALTLIGAASDQPTETATEGEIHGNPQGRYRTGEEVQAGASG